MSILFGAFVAAMLSATRLSTYLEENAPEGNFDRAAPARLALLTCQESGHQLKRRALHYHQPDDHDEAACNTKNQHSSTQVYEQTPSGGGVFYEVIKKSECSLS